MHMLAIWWKQGQREWHYAKGQKSLKDEISFSDTKRQYTYIPFIWPKWDQEVALLQTLDNMKQITN
jgi:hypothetical protein